MRRNRSRSKTILSSPVTLILAIILLAIMARSASKIHTKAALSAEKLAEAQAGMNKLAANRDSVSAKLDNLSTDDGIAAEIRAKYHAVEPGESVAVVVNTDLSRNAGALATSTEAMAHVSWWKRFLQAIGF